MILGLPYGLETSLYFEDGSKTSSVPLSSSSNLGLSWILPFLIGSVIADEVIIPLFPRTLPD